MTDNINPITKRTGPLCRLLDYKGKITGNIAVMNPNDLHNLTLTVTIHNLNKTPFGIILQETKLIPANGIITVTFEIPKNINHWEVILDGDNNFYANLYHFDKDGQRDHSLTYRDTELITLAIVLNDLNTPTQSPGHDSSMISKQKHTNSDPPLVLGHNQKPNPSMVFAQKPNSPIIIGQNQKLAQLSSNHDQQLSVQQDQSVNQWD